MYTSQGEGCQIGQTFKEGLRFGGVLYQQIHCDVL